jgi:hypothetical protein
VHAPLSVRQTMTGADLTAFAGDTKAEPLQLARQLALIWHAKDPDPVIVPETQPMPSA